MTVSASYAPLEYAGNGATVAFPVTWPFVAAADLLVTEVVAGAETVKALTTHYTVVQTASGGTVTALTAPATGRTWRIERRTAITQPGLLRLAGSYNPETVEAMIDRPVLQIQELDERVPQIGDPVTGAPLVFDGSGNVIAGSTALTGDLALRAELADSAASKGAELVAFDDPVMPLFLKTTSDMLNGLPVSLLRAIPKNLHAAIRAQSSTDDVSSYIQDAFNAHLHWYAPYGRYALASTLLCPDGLHLSGDGWAAGWTGAAVAAPQGTVFRMLPASDCDAFRQSAKATRYSLHFADFCVDGDGANQTNVGNTPDATYSIYQFNRNAFFFEALYNTTWENVRAQNMRGSGWVIHGDATALCTNFFLEHCSAYNCRVYGVNFRGAATDGHVNHGDYGFGRAAGISLDSPSHTLRAPTVWTSQCQDLADAATHATGTGAVSSATGGIRVNGSNCRVIDATSEGHAGHGIKVTVNGDHCEIKNPSVYLVSSQAATSGLFDGISADAVDDLAIVDPIVRNGLSSTTTIRRAIDVAPGHVRLRVRGGDVRRIAALAAENTGLVVAGLASGDKSDFAWANTVVDAHQNVANTIGAVFATVSFQVENTDSRGAYSDPTFTAPEYGFYRVGTSVCFNPADGTQCQIAVFKNGAEHKRLQAQRAGAAGSIILGGEITVELALGDTLDIRAFCSVNTNTVVGGTVTWLKIHQVAQ